jgi:hypothetical protein
VPRNGVLAETGFSPSAAYAGRRVGARVTTARASARARVAWCRRRGMRPASVGRPGFARPRSRRRSRSKPVRPCVGSAPTSGGTAPGALHELCGALVRPRSTAKPYVRPRAAAVGAGAQSDSSTNRSCSDLAESRGAPVARFSNEMRPRVCASAHNAQTSGAPPPPPAIGVLPDGKSRTEKPVGIDPAAAEPMQVQSRALCRYGHGAVSRDARRRCRGARHKQSLGTDLESWTAVVGWRPGFRDCYPRRTTIPPGWGSASGLRSRAAPVLPRTWFWPSVPLVRGRRLTVM